METERMHHLSKVMLLYAILVLAYVILGIALPPSYATISNYNLSIPEYRALVILTDIPTVVVWFSALYGYASLEGYARLIRKNPDGQSFSRIAIGLRWLAWGLPATSILTLILGALVHSQPHLRNEAFILMHAASVIVSVFAFTYMGQGSRGLMHMIKKLYSAQTIQRIVISFSVIGVLYCFVVTREIHSATMPPFYLPTWAVLFTIIMPYLYAWFMGLISAYDLFIYGLSTRGVLYKKALRAISLGMGIVICSSIGLQFIASDMSHFRKITFNATFLVVYSLLLLYAVGYYLIAVGAKRLKRIEEV